jgi:hypothetical protein
MEAEASRGHEFADTVHRVLSNRYRRRILEYLGGEGVATFDELVERLVDDAPEPAAPDCEQIEIELDHEHLPLLVETDVITYDGDRIALTPQGQTTAEVGQIVEKCLDERRA